MRSEINRTEFVGRQCLVTRTRVIIQTHSWQASGGKIAQCAAVAFRTPALITVYIIILPLFYVIAVIIMIISLCLTNIICNMISVYHKASISHYNNTKIIKFG